MSFLDKLKKKNKDKIDEYNLPPIKPIEPIIVFDKYDVENFSWMDVKYPYKFNYKYDSCHATSVAQVIKSMADVDIYSHRFYQYKFTDVVNFAIKNNIRIINFSGRCSYSDKRENALKKFYEYGGIFVAACGNDDSDDYSDYPASSPYSISVSAINSGDNNGEIDITGYSYFTTLKEDGGIMDSFNGTSCSTPTISACISYILTLFPHYNLDDVKSYLKRFSKGRDEYKSITNGWLEENERFFSFPDNYESDGVEYMEVKFFLGEVIPEWIEVSKGRPFATVDGESYSLLQEPIITAENNRALIPLRDIINILDKAGIKNILEYDNETRTVTIKIEKQN